MLGLGLSLYNNFARVLSIPPTEFNPIDIPNLDLWLDASTIETDGSVFDGTTGALSLWNDKSGSNNDAIQTNGSSQPIYTPGKVTFNGINNWLNISDATITSINDVSVFYVVKDLSFTNTRYVIGSGTINRFYLGTNPTGANSSKQRLTKSDLNMECITPLPEYYIAQYVIDSTTANLTHNDDVGCSGATTLGGSVPQLNIGSFKEGLDGFLHSEVMEILIYNKVLTAQEIIDLRTYLNTKWSVY